MNASPKRVDVGRQRSALLVSVAALLLALVMYAPGLLTGYAIFRDIEPGFTAGAGYYGDSGLVTAVTPGSAAGRAGIRSGDRVTILPADDRAFHSLIVSPNWAMHVRVRRDNRDLGTVTLAGIVRPFARPDPLFAARAIRIAAALLSIVIAGWAFVGRPSMLTFSFLTFAFATGPTALMTSLGWLSSPPLDAVMIGIAFGLPSPGYAALAWFVLAFPADRPAPNLKRPELLVLASGVALGAFAFTIGAIEAHHDLPHLLQQAPFILDSLGLLGIAGYAFARIRTSRGTERERLKWVAPAILVTALSQSAAGLIQNLLAFGHEGWETVGRSIGALEIVLPLAVAYAVLRQRVFDVRYVVGRGAALVILGGVAFCCVSLIEWSIARVLASFSLNYAIDAAASVVVGFGLSSVHKRVERRIDDLLFRERRNAVAALMRYARSLSRANRTVAVEGGIVDQAAGTLRLADSAYYRHTGDQFRLTRASGTRAVPPSFDDDSTLGRMARAERRPLRFEALRDAIDLPVDPAYWELAIPLFDDDELLGIALYGEHSDGRALEEDEREALEALSERAASALGRIRLQALREEITSLRAELHLSRVAEDDPALAPNAVNLTLERGES